MADYSDKNKPQINIGDYLPEVYKSDINQSISNTVLDKYLSKDDTVQVSGYVGVNNAQTIVNRQLVESSTDSHDQSHRQAFQLAPTMYSKHGTTESALSFKHFCTQLELMGVDIDRMSLWASALEFNWIPPVNIDMLANYQDYFWNTGAVSDLPQYLTVENTCNKSKDRSYAFELLMEQRGTHLLIVDINVQTNSFVIEGLHTTTITPGFNFTTTLTNSPTLVDKHWSVVDVYYNSGSDKTIVEVLEHIVPTTQPVNPVIGSWWYNNSIIKTWNSSEWVPYVDAINAQIVLPALFSILSSSFSNHSFTVNGRQDDVFTNGLVFVTTNTDVYNIQNKAWTVATAVFDELTYTTLITTVEPFAYTNEAAPTTLYEGEWWYKPSTNILYTYNGTSWLATNPTIRADISLSELLLAIKSDLNCKCYNETGWDINQWDDNSIGNVAWNPTLLAQISFHTEAQWIAHNANDISMVDADNSPALYSVWYDLTTNQLKQYGDPTHNITNPLFLAYWHVTMSNFSAVLTLTTATSNWDDAIGCTPQILNHWSSQNKWQHKSAVKSYSTAKRAQIPILEYDSNIELNEWTHVERNWKYRASTYQTFELSTIKPTRIELEPIKGYQVESTSTDWYIYLFDKRSTMNANVDLTSVFIPGYIFMVIDDSGSSNVYTVDWSEFRKMNTSSNANLVGNYMATVVKIKELAFTSPMAGGPNNARIIPVHTSAGDHWSGYHSHWVLDITNTVSNPIKPAQMNAFRYDDIASSGTVDAISGNMAYQNFTPQVNMITYGNTYQEITINIPNVRDVDLINLLRYDAITSTHYATPNSNDLRVYVNGSRQYGTYTEITATSFPSYTAIGVTTHNGLLITYVKGIKFDVGNTLIVGDVVRIEVGPASMHDMGMYSVPVRTVESDVLFNAEVATNTQPIYMSLVEFELNEQAKINLNQYPLFNVYNLLTGDVVLASSIISFTEDSSSAVNNVIQRRILTSANGIEYQFDQHLLDRDDNILYGYRNIKNVELGQYWYSPYTSALLCWDGYAWTDRLLLSSTNGVALRTPIVSATDPIDYWNIDQTIWFNTTSNTLYRRNVATTNWIAIPNVIINDADPSLQTVWRHGLNYENYIPQYVDANRNIVSVGSIDGSWELVHQWKYNPEHCNRRSIKLSHLTTHFKNIIDQQPIVQGLIGSGVYTKTQSEFNYGIGGTIKEFNGAFDTLISAVNVTNTTPIGVIEYAADEYAATIRAVRDMFNHYIVDLLGNYSVDTLIDFTSHIVNSVISIYENNDFYARTFGDTSSYNATTNTGVKNWIATSPMFGLSTLYRPHILSEGEFVQVYNHDGHRTTVLYTTAEEDALVRKIIALSDPRVAGYTMGGIGASLPPSTETNFISSYGGSAVRPGVFWYNTIAPRSFYRLEAYKIGPTHPTIFVNGIEINDGVMYYNDITHNVFKKVGTAWVAITAPGSFDITPLWQIVDLQLLLSKVYLEIETRLYNVCVGVLPAYDYSTLTPNLSELAVYNNKRLKRFNEYVINQSVPAPFINVQYIQTDAFTWNYYTSLIYTPPQSLNIPNPAASWQTMYTNWYGTPYPQLEPWKLQGYHDKPTWWDLEYLDTTGARRWKFQYAPTGLGLGIGMWENIRTGKVPTGRTYPDGRISTGNTSIDGQSLCTYIYFSVNIGNTSIVGGYESDDLLPPYYATSDVHNRSIFTNINQILSPSADYVFGDGNQIEWQWSVSSRYPYEQSIIAFQMQPVKFLRASFGPRYTLVDGLELDVTFNQVYSHVDALFHGDMVSATTTYEARGLNQWYVNFNRFGGFDTSDDFRALWVGWKPLLTYQFNGIIDTTTLDIANKHFDVINQDYNVVLTNSGAFKDLWVDAFNIGVLSIPPAILQYNNQNKWKLEINSLAAISREISYYDVKAYPFIVDTNLNQCHAYRYYIVGVDSVANRFYVAGDETDIFPTGEQIVVSGATLSNGIFSVLSSAYEPSNDRTRINVLQSITGSIADGVINVSSFEFPWATGTTVVLSSTKNLPSPLVPNTPYYIVNDGSQIFKLAETFSDSFNGIVIDIISMGTGINMVAEILSSFMVLGGESHSTDTWYHYALDKTKIRSMTPPHVINGLQTLINVIDGYAEHQHDAGIINNTADSGDFDHNTGRYINWSFEVERFIDWAHGLRLARLSVNDRFNFNVNTTDNTLTFIDAIPSWVNGTAIQISTTGSMPSPLIASDTYYVYNTGISGVIKLSTSRDVLYLDYLVDLTTVGSGHLYIAVKDVARTYPMFEINPTRNNIWLDTPEGLLADVVQGPYTDIRVRQTIYDQYGRITDPSNLLVYRQDKRSRISIVPNIPNDVDPYYTDDPYNYIHLGGGHFFLEGYEHFLIFNPYTSGDILIYDSFLGLYASTFEVSFYKGSERTLRPNLGGYYLKNNEFLRNIEGAATDLHNFYDTYAGSEDSPIIKRARSLLGYSSKVDYMELLNVNSKSQFLFYRGMLHAKGSVSSIMAYINSRRFVDARVDEYWAVKIAEFGDNRYKVYPEILLTDTDGRSDDVRLEFIGLEDDPNNTRVQIAVNEKRFNLISFADDSRWNNFPDQRADIVQPLFLDAKISSVTRILVSSNPPPKIFIPDIDYWYNHTKLQAWKGSSWVEVAYDKIHTNETHLFVKHDNPCDDVRLVRREANTFRRNVSVLSINSYTNNEMSNAFVLSNDLTGYIYNGSVITISGAGANDGNYTVLQSIYNMSLNKTYVIVGTQVDLDASDVGTLGYNYIDFNFYNSIHMVPGDSGNVCYYKLNANVVRTDITAFFGIMHIYTIAPDEGKLNPAKLVDKETNTLISQITLWHPAYNLHYYRANHNIDLRHDHDPAVYSNNANNDINDSNFWNFDKVGTTWLDINSLAYIPYYDDVIYPDINNRLHQWGKLTPFADVHVYQWVRSTVLPSEWDALAVKQQGDLSIAQTDRLTGIARKTVFKRTRKTSAGTITFNTSNQQTVVTVPSVLVTNGQIVFITSTSTLPVELQSRREFEVTATVNSNNPITQQSTQQFKLLDTTTGEVVSITNTPNPVKVINVGTNNTPIWVFQVDSGIVDTDDLIQFSTILGGSLPNCNPIIQASTNYKITEIVDVNGTSSQTFRITKIDNIPIVILDEGIGDISGTISLEGINVAISFSNELWIKDTFKQARVFGAWLNSSLEPTITWHNETTPISAAWVNLDSVDLYINGVLFKTGSIVTVSNNICTVSTLGTNMQINPYDYIDVVHNIHSLTSEEASFDPTVSDDGTLLVQWKEDYEYSRSVVSVGSSGISTLNYYFWVENSTVNSADSSSMSLLEIRNSMVNMPAPYFIVQQPLDANPMLDQGYGYDQPDYGTIWGMGEVPEFLNKIPIMYREAIVRNISSYINNDSSYMIQFTRDMTLRSTLSSPTTELEAKNKHSEWLLFRQHQPNNISLFLWNKVLESLSGVALITRLPVPSLDRVLYDDKYGTETRYGLNLGQTFVDRVNGINTVLSYLRNSDKDFAPIDIDNFLNTYDFNTSSGVESAMIEIYNTFSSEHVNGIWFELLYDALSSKAKYKGLMKTSWVALHGIQILGVNGVFDD